MSVSLAAPAALAGPWDCPPCSGQPGAQAADCTCTSRCGQLRCTGTGLVAAANRLAPSALVREPAAITDAFGIITHIGIDHDHVTVRIGHHTAVYDLAGMWAFLLHYVQAVHAATAQAGRECNGPCCFTAERE